MRKAVAILVDVKGRCYPRKLVAAFLKYSDGDLELMVGGEIDKKALKIREINIGEHLIKKPIMVTNKNADSIPLPPNIFVQNLLKKYLKNPNLPLGNVVFVSLYKLEK